MGTTGAAGRCRSATSWIDHYADEQIMLSTWYTLARSEGAGRNDYFRILARLCLRGGLGRAAPSSRVLDPKGRARCPACSQTRANFPAGEVSMSALDPRFAPPSLSGRPWPCCGSVGVVSDTAAPGVPLRPTATSGSDNGAARASAHGLSARGAYSISFSLTPRGNKPSQVIARLGAG